MLLLIAPAAAILLLFQVVPILIGANASFRDWTLYDPKKTWVGLAHYTAVVTDRAFLTIVLPSNPDVKFLWRRRGDAEIRSIPWGRWVACEFTLITLLIINLVLMACGSVLREANVANDQFGIVNVVLEALGFEGQPWLAQRWTAFAVIVLTDVWLWTPWFTLLLLAGLQSLPREPFEAAAIDGAGRFSVLRFVTLPLLSSVLVVCAVIRAIDAFRTFDIVWTLSGGGPGRSTELFSLYAYVYAFLNLDFGKGSAAAMIGGAIILVVGLGLFRVLDRLVQVSR